MTAIEATATKKGFFDWCDRHRIEARDVWKHFRVCRQTVRNWRKKKDDETLPPWIPLACVAVAALLAGEISEENLPEASAEGLLAWQRSHGFKTYKNTADVFDIERQAVHNWFKRQKFPNWLPLACAGYDLRIQSSKRVDSANA